MRSSSLFLHTIALIASIAFAPPGRSQTTPPPLFGPGERVVFQGDSITDMGRGRSEDPNHILGHGYVFLIASSHGAAYPERQILFVNRGVSGNTVQDLAKRWKTDVLDLQPDTLSVLIGINDVYFSFKNHQPLDPPALERTYADLLSQARAQKPGLRLILGEPFLLPGNHNAGHWDEWKAAVTQLQEMTARVAARFNAPVVHYQRVFDEAVQRAPVTTWIWDGIHPTYSGHTLMAREWQRVFEEFYAPKPPAGTTNTALLPTPKLENDSYDWYARHLQVLELQKFTPAEIVLVGDSITHFWAGEPTAARRSGPESWKAAFGHRPVLNLGFGWDRTQNVLWRLDHGEMDGLTPKLIILNIGTNNLTGTEHARTNTPAEIAEAIAFVCRKLHAKSPGSQILVMNVFPRGFEPDAPLRAPIRALNAALPDVLRDQSYVHLLDLTGQFLAADGSLSPELMSDSTHPTEKGYAIWARGLIDSGLLPPEKTR